MNKSVKTELQQTLLTFVFTLTMCSNGQWEKIYGYYATSAKAAHSNEVSDPFIITAHACLTNSLQTAYMITTSKLSNAILNFSLFRTLCILKSNP